MNVFFFYSVLKFFIFIQKTKISSSLIIGMTYFFRCINQCGTTFSVKKLLTYACRKIITLRERNILTLSNLCMKDKDSVNIFLLIFHTTDFTKLRLKYFLN